MEDNKLGGLVAVITVLTIATILIGLLGLVNQELGEAVIEEATATNENLTGVINGSHNIVTNSNIIGTPTIVQNASLLGSGNYTIHRASGAISWQCLPNCTAAGTQYLINYTYNDYSDALYQNINSTMTISTDLSSDWMPLLVIMAMIGFVVGLIVVIYSRKNAM